MRVGRYRFVDRLAVGGMAEVFVAVATGAQGFEKPVVVKRMLPQLAGNPSVHRMFLDEARTMLNLQHGNIVQILDMGLMDGAPFLALEYIDGKDLKTVLERLWQTGGAMPHGLAAYIAGEVCRALDYAHRKTDARGLPLHIVHRDVNPANIFLSHEGGVKVGDFGLAKARDNLQRSDAGTVKGKVSYLSPEQANGREVDHRSDIFSLGATLYEMCCSRRAFDAPSDVEVVLKIRECRSTPPSAVAPHIDPDLESIITRAMRADPADRFETADNMREALSRYLGKLPSVPEDRELDDFLEKLFGNDRRSNAAVIKMAPLANGLPLVSSATHTADVVAPPVSARGHVGGSRRPGRARRLLVVAVIVLALGATAGVHRILSHGPMARLTISSNAANAAVFLDGQDTGRRTPVVIKNLVVGRSYQIMVRHPDWAEAGRRFHFSREGDHAHRFVLQRLKEALAIETVPPAADVLVNGELRGQSPLTLTLSRGGKYTVEILKNGYRPKEIQHYAEQPRARLRIDLDRDRRPVRRGLRTSKRSGRRRTRSAGKKGVLEVSTAVAARVFVDGRFAGRTPGLRLELPAGNHKVLVSPDKAKVRYQATVRIVGGKTNRVTLTPPPGSSKPASR